MAKKKKINNKKFLRVDYSNILQDDNPKLREISDAVQFPLNKENDLIMKQMIDYVRSSQNPNEAKIRKLKTAVGISAIQIGHLRRLIYIRTLDEFNNPLEEFALINPIIKSLGNEKCYVEGGEGCLSVKKAYVGIVPRSFTIKLEAIDYFTDRVIEIEAKGYSAVVIQHELDHLDGILFYDRINKLDPNFKPKNAIKI